MEKFKEMLTYFRHNPFKIERKMEKSRFLSSIFFLFVLLLLSVIATLTLIIGITTLYPYFQQNESVDRVETWTFGDEEIPVFVPNEANREM